MPDDDSFAPVIIARVFQISGSVQGLGFRPELARLAMSLRLKGTVANSTCGVEMHLEGEATNLDTFASECLKVCPKAGRVDQLIVRDAELLRFTQVILDASSEEMPLRTHVPLDRICCEACWAEVMDSSNSRCDYLLNTCSDCGPRYTLIHSMPYERHRTALGSFPLCEGCQEEYESARNRRFHSQGIVCPKCGPRLSNVERAVEDLLRGDVVAVKGIGGFQFVVVASNVDAIKKLRTVKQRFDKPFVVMVSNLQEAHQVGVLTPTDECLLSSEAGPVVIVEQKKFAESAAITVQHSLLSTKNLLTSGLSSIGLMLPTMPLHRWLLDRVGPLVVTSANLEGEPMITSDVEMMESELIHDDRIVFHDREIVRHADDSVIRVMAKRGVTIRLGRGLGPLVLPWHDQDAGANIVALGGHQKVAIALCNGYQSVLGPHLGDMDGLKARERFAQHVRDLLKLYGGQPKLIVHDLHPDFFTSRWAQELARETGADTLGVQHHHAHLASGVMDAEWWDRSFVGISWDGTGFGADGTIWGGEAFLGSVDKLERFVSLYPFHLPGGEQAIYEPYRIAESLLWESYGESIPINPLGVTRSAIQKMIAGKTHAPQTTSVGRLFDGIAALILASRSLGSSSRISYEGHWAMLLESMGSEALDKDHDACRYEMPLITNVARTASDWPFQPRYLWDWRPLVRRIVEDLSSGISPCIISLHFHRALAKAIMNLGQKSHGLPLLFTGGVFQNKVLLELVAGACDDNRLEWHIPTQIPVNDGGLAAGQLLLGLIHQRNKRCV